MIDDALVVFHDHGSHWLNPLLKKGFRHAFAVVCDGVHWIRVDAKTGVPDFEIVAPYTGKNGFTPNDLATFYVGQGFTVLNVKRGTGVYGPLVYANCVGLVKAALGINAFGVITPYALYRRLKR